jgi:NDP-sugar pyrophosphorylase family protein
MGALTETVPKPLLPNPANSLIGHQIDMLRRHVNQLYVTTGYLKEKLKLSLAKSEIDDFIDVDGHGNAYFLNLLNGIPENSRILVITCDNLMSINLASLELEARSHETSLIVPKATTNFATGDFIEHRNGQILTMQRRTGTGLVASGLQVLHARDVVTLQAGSVNDFREVWGCLIKRGSLRVSNTPINCWWAIDTEDALNDWIKSSG